MWKISCVCLRACEFLVIRRCVHENSRDWCKWLIRRGTMGLSDPSVITCDWFLLASSCDWFYVGSRSCTRDWFHAVIAVSAVASPLVKTSSVKSLDPWTEAGARSWEKENDWGAVQSVLPPGNSSVTVEMWTDRGRGGIVWGEGGRRGHNTSARGGWYSMLKLL